MDSQKLDILVWELLRNHQSVAKLDEYTDPVIYRKVLQISSELNQRFSAVEKIALADLDMIPRDVSEEEQKLHAETSLYPSIVLKMLSKEQYAPMIWELIKPKDRDNYEQRAG